MGVEFYHAERFGMEVVKISDWQVSYPFHNHVSIFSVGVLLDGRIRVEIGDDVSRIGRGECFTVAPLVPHRIFATEPYSLFCLCVKKEAVYREPSQVLHSRALCLLRKAYGDGEPGGWWAPTLRRAIFSLKNFTGEADGADEEIRRATALLADRPEASLPIEFLSAQSHCSKSYFIRKFKAAVGLPPHRFQLQNRVRKAQRLLPHARSVADAALAAGFYDQSHFIRAFMRQTGLSPSAYRLASRQVDVG